MPQSNISELQQFLGAFNTGYSQEPSQTGSPVSSTPGGLGLGEDFVAQYFEKFSEMFEPAEDTENTSGLSVGFGVTSYTP